MHKFLEAFEAFFKDFFSSVLIFAAMMISTICLVILFKSSQLLFGMFIAVVTLSALVDAVQTWGKLSRIEELDQQISRRMEEAAAKEASQPRPDEPAVEHTEN